MADKIELMDKRIIYIREQGRLGKKELETTVHARVAFAKEHIDGFYVVIYDTQAAQVAFMDLRVNRWAMEIDPNMIELVSINTQTIARVTTNLLTSSMGLPITTVGTLDEAKARAHAVIEAEMKKRGINT